jgi:RND family efflux transporter MFP subunit
MRRLTYAGRLLASLSVLLSASAAIAQGPPPADPPPVTVAKPVMKDVQDMDEFIGRFEGIQRVEVRARVQGYLDKIHFTDGALVKAGDPLFTIDQRPYKLAVEQAESAVSNNQARVEFAQTDLDRAEQLRRSGTISGQSNDQRRQNFLTAQADLAGGRPPLRMPSSILNSPRSARPSPGRISRRLVTEVTSSRLTRRS